MLKDMSAKCSTEPPPILDKYRPTLVMETGHEAEGDRTAIHDRLCRARLSDARHSARLRDGLRPIGRPTSRWPRRFEMGEAHNLLLAPE